MTYPMERQGRARRWLLPAAATGLAHWFFGNLYEAIIVSPNSMAIIEAGQNPGETMFPRIAPTWYYMPHGVLTPLAVGAALIVGRHDATRRASLLWAAGGTLVGEALTAVAVTQVNLKLYVGKNRETDPVRMRSLQRLWDTVNAARLISVGVALIATLQAMKPTDTHVAA